MLVLFVSCSNNRNSDEKTESRDTTQGSSRHYIDSVNKKQSGKPNVYVFNNDSLTQTLKIKYQSAQEISFELISNNRVNGKTRRFQELQKEIQIRTRKWMKMTTATAMRQQIIITKRITVQ